VGAQREVRVHADPLRPSRQVRERRLRRPPRRTVRRSRFSTAAAR
jgi:hypothetical protein